MATKKKAKAKKSSNSTVEIKNTFEAISQEQPQQEQEVQQEQQDVEDVVEKPTEVFVNQDVKAVEASACPQSVDNTVDPLKALPISLRPDRLELTLDLLAQYRKEELESLVKDIDLDVDTKQYLVEIWHDLGWIKDYSQLIFLLAKNGLWEFAGTVAEWSLANGKSIKHQQTLRKLIGNWNGFKDRYKLKQLCVSIIRFDPKSMVSLNEWAKEHGKQLGLVVKGYCDLCQGDAKTFAMNYSEL